LAARVAELETLVHLQKENSNEENSFGPVGSRFDAGFHDQRFPESQNVL
jgi:hypothetical protein